MENHLSGPCDLEDLHSACDDVLDSLLTDAAQVNGRDFPQATLWGHPRLSKARGHVCLLLLRGHDRHNVTRTKSLLREWSRHLKTDIIH